MTTMDFNNRASGNITDKHVRPYGYGSLAISNLSDAETPLLEGHTVVAKVVVDGCIDYRHLPSIAFTAENVNAWSGTSMILPLVGAFVAESFLGHYSVSRDKQGLKLL
ncbi:hypothetical protein JRO89_XS07G0264500 [Xanthoceras sorbifolium]|uniref:Peptidase S8/S53 domain-containing protein n=1 Tax=Xanthoceras sorbifolium TaxID=99658 RepID=A0ABQ8HV39_9ROSI|nr:hypothetical protein JRO89_XS07G0264500 [Xanthoceras sorbifolium]